MFTPWVLVLSISTKNHSEIEVINAPTERDSELGHHILRNSWWYVYDISWRCLGIVFRQQQEIGLFKGVSKHGEKNPLKKPSDVKPPAEVMIITIIFGGISRRSHMAYVVPEHDWFREMISDGLEALSRDGDLFHITAVVFWDGIPTRLIDLL